MEHFQKKPSRSNTPNGLSSSQESGQPKAVDKTFHRSNSAINLGRQSPLLVEKETVAEIKATSKDSTETVDIGDDIIKQVIKSYLKHRVHQSLKASIEDDIIKL